MHLWLQHEHLTDRLPWSVTRAEFTGPEVTYDNFQRIVDFPQEYLDQVANLPLWSNYWDQSCGDVVAELAPTLSWNAFKEATDVILARWGDAKDQLPEDTPYFYARYHQEYPVQSGKDYVILETAGQGTLCGHRVVSAHAQPVLVRRRR